MKIIEQQIANLDKALSAKDIDSVLAIYSKNACLVKQPGELARGIDEIAEHYKTLFSLNIPMTITTEAVNTIQSESLVLVTSSWTLKGVDPNGNAGSVKKIANMVFTWGEGDKWLLLIDNPFGPELVANVNA